LKALIDLIIKLRVFGEVHCWMYLIKWQNTGLPHAHILIWLVRKITPDQIDSIISAEIPDEIADPELFEYNPWSLRCTQFEFSMHDRW
jgi:hypothetical protein